MQSEMDQQMKQKERKLQEEMTSMQRKHEMQIEEVSLTPPSAEGRDMSSTLAAFLHLVYQ